MVDVLYLLGWNQLIAVLMGMAVWASCRTRMLRRRPAMCHGLWLLVLVKLVTPPIVPVPVLPAAVAEAQRSAAPLLSAAPLVGCASTSPPPPGDDSETSRALPAVAIFKCPEFVAAEAPPSPSSADPPSEARPWTWPETFAALGGISLLASCGLWIAAVRQLVQVRRLLRGKAVESGRAAELLRQVSQRFNRRGAVKLHLVDAPTTPMLWAEPGKPAIVLPRHLVDSLSDDGLRSIIAHELGHFVRRDHWTNLFALVVTTLFWWNPIGWFARRQLSAAAEACSDAVALERLRGSRKTYAETLLSVVDSLTTIRPLRSPLSIAFGQSHPLVRRFEMIADPGVTARMTPRGWMLTAVAMATLALVPVRAEQDVSPSSAAGGGLIEGQADKVQDTVATAAESASQDGSVIAQDKLAAHFSGRVTGPDGEPVSGARVYLAPKSDKPDEPVGKLAVRAVTGGDGRFAFDAPDMTHLDNDGLPARLEGFITAVADGYGPDFMYTWSRREAVAQAKRGRGDQASFELQLAKDDVPIRGQFLGPDGRPLAGARVRLADLLIPPGRDLEAHLEREKNRSPLGCSPGYERSLAARPHLLGGVAIETRTDAEGRFTMSGLGRDRLVRLTVSAPSVVDTHVTVMTRAAADTAIRTGGQDAIFTSIPPSVIRGADFKLLLQRGRTISGVVIDADTRKPIPGMIVGGGREGFPRDGVWHHETVTDAQGRFAITGLDPAVDKRPLTAMSPPGMAYQPSGVVVTDDKPVTIECERGIPFRLRLVDDEGRPVEAEVAYFEILPNPHAPKYYCHPCSTPISRTARQADGTYQGFVVPGPGVVLVTTPNRDYRPPQVDPKAFFAPGRTDWSGRVLTGAVTIERANSFGTKDRLMTSMGRVEQDNYAAIVLVNPAPGAGPLELSATVFKDAPRQASLVDPDGQPVVGATTQGMTQYSYDSEPTLRVATFPLRKLHPERVRRITFFEEERKLIGFLAARGDGAAPYTVRMQPWGTITGRLLDASGKPLSAILSLGNPSGETSADPTLGEHEGLKTGDDGRFRLDRLVPGLRYTARVFRRVDLPADKAFENVVVGPGEVRDLGDVRVDPLLIANVDLSLRERRLLAQ